jgi:hypothetical protein
MQTMTEKEHQAERIDLKALVGGDRDFLRQLIRATLQSAGSGNDRGPESGQA